jgi:hypothetical protein
MARALAMRNRRLERVRLARVRCNENIVRLESKLAYQRQRRDAIEAEIQSIASDLRLPVPNRRRNPIFARGEIPRLSLQVLREAGEPLAVSVIARRVLQAKGIELPTIHVQRMTRARVRTYFSVLGKRGFVQTVGVGNKAKRGLKE